MARIILEKDKYDIISIMAMDDIGSYEGGILTAVISSRAVAQIIDFFLDHREFDYSPAEIAKKTGLSFRTIFRELPILEQNHIIYTNRKIGKTNMYRLNADLKAVGMLEQFALEMAQIINAPKAIRNDLKGDLAELDIPE